MSRKQKKQPISESNPQVTSKWPKVTTNQPISQAKQSLVADVQKHLERNIVDVAKNNYKLKGISRLGRNREMLDDFLSGKIQNCYMPVTYDHIIEWTRQEPLIIERPIHPCFFNEESGVLAIIRSNIHNYLKQYAYKFIKNWTKRAKREASRASWANTDEASKEEELVE